MDALNAEFGGTLRGPEFQAVLIIDYDDGRMFPLTEDCPKCLLPVGNRRLLSYQLDVLAKSGIAGIEHAALSVLALPPHYLSSLAPHFVFHPALQRCT
jgi:hypothetical protein